jgi:hypothetical protein
MAVGWKKLEDRVWGELKGLVARYPVFVHRFYDTKSAGAAMPSQPADFLMIVNGQAIFIECKHSEKYATLRSCFSGHVDDQQIASAKLVLRAGAHYYVLFAGTDMLVELWPGAHLIEQRTCGKPLKLNYRHAYPSVSEAIQCLANAALPVSFSSR